MEKAMNQMLQHQLDRIRFKIKSALSPGYEIDRSGNYALVPDRWGVTETRVIYDSDKVMVCITEMEGPRKAREERFDLDMEVELVRGDLIYKFPELGTEEVMEFKKKILIPAGVLFTYEFKSKQMACIFTMYKTPFQCSKESD